MSAEKHQTVYSTDCDIPKKGSQPESGNLKSSQLRVPVAQQRVCVRLDKKRRGGKSVTLIEGLQMASGEKEMLLKQIKTRFGSGGAVKDAVIEIQGDHRDAIITILDGLGYRPKRSGG